MSNTVNVDDPDALVDAIPDLEINNLPDYLAAVNQAVMYGGLAVGQAKVMLYAVQLLLAVGQAQPQAPRIGGHEPGTIDL